MKIDFQKGDGLVPAIIQNADTLQVLMLGYMNDEALQATQNSGYVTFYSRSRNCLWRKGETSGNTLMLVEITADCDNDTLLVRARSAGPTCHLGTVSCFNDQENNKQGPAGLAWLVELAALIEGRKTSNPENSYTAKLLQGPLNKCAQKVGEEGVETVIAAIAETDREFTAEAADLLYHLMILIAAKNLSLIDVVQELKNRS